MRFERLIAAVVLSSACLCLSVVAAQAEGGGTGREPLPTTPDFTVNCPQGFLAVVHTTFNKEYGMTFNARDGSARSVITGALLITVTGNGETLAFNNSGTGTFYFAAEDGLVSVVGSGPNGYIPPDLSGLFIYYGRIVIDPNTGLVVTHEGTVTDVCALLS